MLYIDPEKQKRYSVSRAIGKPGLVPLYDVKPPFDCGTQWLRDAGSVLGANGQWYINWIVEDKTADQKCECLTKRAKTVRDELVVKSQDLINNWTRKISIATRLGNPTTTLSTQLADLEDFQQELCDIPAQLDFPNSVVWPSIPASWSGVEVSGVNISDYYNDKIAHWSEPQES